VSTLSLRGDLRLEGGSLTVRDGRLASLESDAHADVQVDAANCAVIPGFVDCHTHLPFAGWRADEYEQKVTGIPGRAHPVPLRPQPGSGRVRVRRARLCASRPGVAALVTA
jgi:cytosine/adenosine deaminase-related metal-dependent hydrolase